MTDVSGATRPHEPAYAQPTQLIVTAVEEEVAPTGLKFFGNARFGAGTRTGAGTGNDAGGSSGTTSATAKVGTAARPVVVVARGLGRQLRWLLAWWLHANKRGRRIGLAVLGVGAIAVLLLPHSGLILLAGILTTAALAGRAPGLQTSRKLTPAQAVRLQSIYNGLVPYLTDEYDPEQTFVPGAEFGKAFDSWTFDAAGRLVKLELHYSPYFRDCEPESRAKVERVIERRTGSGNDYLYEWSEEQNRLVVAVLPRSLADR